MTPSYLAAVLVGGGIGLVLAPETARFVAEGVGDFRYIEKLGIAPAALGLVPSVT